MIKNSLREFVDRVLESGSIGDRDVKQLGHVIMADNLASREEADVLIALDRVIGRKCAAWDEVLLRLVVDFAVWTQRPTGFVDADAARWLVTSLGAAGGPTPNGVRLAFEIVREAQQVDETLVAFVMGGVRVDGGTETAQRAWQGLLAADAA